MNQELTDVEKLITETFTAHEHLAPDGDQVLAAARDRIDRKRTMLNRPLAVAAGVVALTLAAATVVVLNRATPETGLAAPADRVQTTSPVREPAIADLTMPFSLDWLPPGKVDYLARRINIGATAEDLNTPVYGGEYMLNVTTDDGHALFVDVQQVAGPPGPNGFKSGPGRPVTVNGQPGFESSQSGGPGGYEMYVTHPGGGSMYVHVSGQHGTTVPESTLVDAGRRIAEHIRFPGTTSVTPTFGFRDLPAGLRICAFDVESPSDLRPDTSTGYALGTCTGMPPIHAAAASEMDPRGTPGQPVLGHQTSYVNEDGYHRLWVLDAVNGAPVHIAGEVPLTDLYDIANRLVLPR